MRFITTSFLLIFALAFPASAEEITLSVDRAIALRNALSSLDGYERAVKDGANERIIKESYKFDPGARWAMSKNITALTPIFDSYRVAVNATIASIAGSKGKIDPGTTEEVEFNRQREELGKAMVTVDVVMLKQEELKAEVNPIPPLILSFVSPVITQK